MALGWTYVVLRLPEELRHADAETVKNAVLAEPPGANAKVGQWDSFGPTTYEPEAADDIVDDGTRLFVRSNFGYPETSIVKAKHLLDRCPALDPDEWVVVEAWDMS